VRNLEQCFQMLGAQPRALENFTVDGLKRDHDTFLQQQPPREALTLFDLYAGYQTEYLEIAMYQNLIDAANSLGLSFCIQLFQENLAQEIEAAKKVSTIAHEYGEQQLKSGKRAPTDASLAGQPYGSSESVAPGQYVTPTTVGTSQPYREGNLAQQQSNSFTESDTTPENKQQATQANSPTMATSNNVQSGMEVVGSDMRHVGQVSEVLDNDFRLDIPMQRDLYVPFSAIQTVDQQAGRVVLNVSSDQVGNMGWPHPSLA
jgi:hypothetical protein